MIKFGYYKVDNGGDIMMNSDANIIVQHTMNRPSCHYHMLSSEHITVSAPLSNIGSTKFYHNLLQDPMLLYINLNHISHLI